MLSAGYGEIEVLHKVSLDVPSGRITTIIGPNGAGKSTLLRALFGFVRVTSGRVLLNGEDVTNAPTITLLRKGIAYVGQGRVNFPAMTVEENLEMGAYVRNDPGVREEVSRLMARFPVLATKRREMAGDLSGGEQQVLEMAMALMLRPRLLLLDEPSLGLAPLMVRSVLEAVREINSVGATILMVEQNAAQALDISDHAVVLDLGRKRKEGPADAILRDPDVKRLYLGGGELKA